jgi:hypothetical protein
MSGVAYDPDDGVIWVANYTGFAPSGTPKYGVAEYTEGGAAVRTFNYATQFLSPLAHESPYSIAVCPSSATGGATVIVVGFIDDGSGKGTGAVQAYSTSGGLLGDYFSGPITSPYALSCGAKGDLFIADKTGLYRGTVTGSGFSGGTAASTFGGLTAPIYGVLVAPGTGTSSKDAGAAKHDAGVDGHGGGGGEAGASDGPHDAPLEGSHEGSTDAPSEASDAGDAGTCVPETCPTNPSTPGWSGEAVTVSPDAGCKLASPFVTKDTTFSASDCQVYEAPDGIFVGSMTAPYPVLTIGPGVAIAFGNEQGLIVGGIGGPGGGGAGAGGLIVAGTACEPVVFTSSAPKLKAGNWSFAELASQTLPYPMTNIQNLILQYSGSHDPAYGGTGTSLYASLLVDGFGGDITVPLSNVTASHNGGTGIAFFGQRTGPSPESCGTLKVTDWPAMTAPDAGTGATLAVDPFLIDYDATGLLSGAQPPLAPSLHLSTGSAKDGYVHLYASTSAAAVDVSQTWPSNAPLPYVLGVGQGQTGTTLSVGSSTYPDAGPVAALTIAAPNTLRLGPGFLFEVDYATNGSSLQANGSASDPITFTTFSATPTPGYWSGIALHYPGSEASTLTYATIDGAGDGTLYNGCAPGEGASSGALELLGNPYENPTICIATLPILSNVSFMNVGKGGDKKAFAIVAVDVNAAMQATLEKEITSPVGGVSICPAYDRCGP